MEQPRPYGDFSQYYEGEEWDRNLPSPGFITDFVLTTRGTESPTIFNTWGAVFTLSSMIRRDAWLKWYPRSLFANMFIFLVSPPGICAKGTPMGVADDILTGYVELLNDKIMREKKLMNIRRSKATKEGIFDVLAPPPETRVFNEKTKRVETVRRGSQLALVVSELGTFLGKEKYNIGLVQKLTDLYDCKTFDDDTTRGSGTSQIEDIYVTLIGGTTPDALKDCIPPEAFGDGFLSRIIIAYQGSSTRVHDMPYSIPGGPTIRDLSERLAWIAENHHGEYRLDDETQEVYKEWYHKEFHPFRVEKVGTKEFRPRYAIHLLKLALLIRIQRYEPGNEITLQDYKEAKRLLDSTIQFSHMATEEVGTSFYQRTHQKIANYIHVKERIERGKLLTYCSSWGCDVSTLNVVLEALRQQGSIAITDSTGKAADSLTRNGKEVYQWAERSS